MRRSFALLALALAPVALSSFGVACSSSSTTSAPDTGVTPDAAVPDPAEPVFTVPAQVSALDDAHFFEHPWPSDFRRDADGSIRLDGYVNPYLSPLIKKYQGQLKGKLGGFSPFAAGYLNLAASLDPTTLPTDPKGSVATTSTLQLIDVDEKSAEVGARHPIRVVYRDRVGDYYLAPHTISWMPILGMPLRPKTKYAIVGTTGLKTPDGRAFAPNAALSQVIAGQGALGTAWAPAIAQLAKAGVAKTSIAHLSVFTTGDPVGELLGAAEVVRATAAPHVTDLAYKSSTASYDRYEGHYDGSPNFQADGTGADSNLAAGFKSGGGDFALGADGKPKVQSTFSLRFLLTVPPVSKCPMPTGGYPIVLYAHGTGGDWYSFDNDGTAAALAGQCLAGMGIDQIFHGVRPGAPKPTDPNVESEEELLFFNVDNALSARTSPRQAALDEVARARMIATGGLAIASGASHNGTAIAFDPKRIAFFGHSQGGLNGPLFLAVDDYARGGVLSGAGSAISYSLLLKTLPTPSVSGLIKALLSIQPENDDEWTELHPVISLLQTLIDTTDPIHYYGAITREPFPGHVAKSVLMTEGVRADGSGDNYAPPRTIESGAIAARYPLFNPVVWNVPELTSYAGVPPIDGPISGNFAGGKATGAIAQFVPPAGVDGHFVVFDVPAARTLAAKFSASLLSDGVPVIGGP
jgi:hypothetical protein